VPHGLAGGGFQARDVAKAADHIYAVAIDRRRAAWAIAHAVAVAAVKSPQFARRQLAVAVRLAAKVQVFELGFAEQAVAARLGLAEELGQLRERHDVVAAVRGRITLVRATEQPLDRLSPSFILGYLSVRVFIGGLDQLFGPASGQSHGVHRFVLGI